MKNHVVFLLFILLMVSPCFSYAEDDMAWRWRDMNKRERDSYALGIRDALSVMCMITSENKKEYSDCVKEYTSSNDMPQSLFDMFDDAYTNRMYSNVPSEILVYIWTERAKRDVKKDLERAEKAAKGMR